MPERPRPMPQEKRATPEAVVGIRKGELRPEVRTFVENLTVQIRDLDKHRETRSTDELRRLSSLSAQLRRTLESGELPEEAMKERRERALAYLDKASEIADEAGSRKGAAYGMIAKAEARIGLVEKAKQTMKQASAYLVDGVYFAITQSEAGMGRIADAESTIGYIRPEDYEERAKAHLSIAAAKEKAGTDGHEHFQRAIQVVEQSPDPLVHDDLLGEIAAAAAGLGWLHEAEEIEKKLSHHGPGGFLDISVNLAIVKAQHNAGVNSDERLAHARRDADSMDETDRLDAYFMIVAAQREIGRSSDDLLALAKETISESAFFTDKPFYLRTVANLQTLDGAFASARETIELIPDREERLHALADHAFELARAGKDSTDALDAARKISIPHQLPGVAYVEAMCALARAEAQAGRDPSLSLSYAVSAISKDPDAFPVNVIAEIARVEARMGRDPSGILGFTLETARQRDEKHKPDAMAEIAAGYADVAVILYRGYA